MGFGLPSAAGHGYFCNDSYSLSLESNIREWPTKLDLLRKLVDDERTLEKKTKVLIERMRAINKGLLDVGPIPFVSLTLRQRRHACDEDLGRNPPSALLLEPERRFTGFENAFRTLHDWPEKIISYGHMKAFCDMEPLMAAVNAGTISEDLKAALYDAFVCNVLGISAGHSFNHGSMKTEAMYFNGSKIDMEVDVGAFGRAVGIAGRLAVAPLYFTKINSQKYNAEVVAALRSRQVHAAYFGILQEVLNNAVRMAHTYQDASDGITAILRIAGLRSNVYWPYPEAEYTFQRIDNGFTITAEEATKHIAEIFTPLIAADQEREADRSGLTPANRFMATPPPFTVSPKMTEHEPVPDEATKPNQAVIKAPVKPKVTIRKKARKQSIVPEVATTTI